MRIIETNPPAAPKVSVLVPVYNTSAFLPACLDSLLAQTLSDIEFICLNDGSTDESLDILLQYQQRDSRIRIVDKPNSGYGATMNLGISLSRAPYVGILESDDFAEPVMFERLYNMACSRMCDLVKCNYYEHADGVDTEQRPFDGFRYGRVFDPRDDKWVLCVLPIIWAALYRKAMIKDNGIRFNETPGASYQDTSFVAQCWAAARRVVLLRDPLIHYRVDNVGSSVKSSSKVFEVCGEYALTQEFLKRDPERQAAFGSLIHLMKLGTYKWNYERIDAESKAAFAKRMTEEYIEAAEEGMLDESMFSPADWALIQDILAGPDTIVARYPESLADPVLFGDDLHPLSVSAVVPVRNAERFLPQCLDSLCNQACDHLEIICVNDGSTDASGDILGDYAARDSRIRVVEKRDLGYAGSINCGIAEATGDYIGIVSPSDWADQGMYAALLDAARHNGLPDIVKTAYWRVCDAGNGDEHVEPAQCLHRVQPPSPVFALSQNADLLYYPPSIWAAMYKRSFLGEHGIGFPAAPDGDRSEGVFFMESLVSAESIVYVDEPLYCHREAVAGPEGPEAVADCWLDMDDVLKRRGVEAPQALKGHYARGCACIQLLDERFPGDGHAAAGAKRIAERIDPLVVLKSRRIAWPLKRALVKRLLPARRTS